MLRNTPNPAANSTRSVMTSLLLALLARPATHVVTVLLILLLDCWTGPSLAFSAVFVLPIVLSAWFCTARLAYGLALLVALGHFLIAAFMNPPTSQLTLAAEGLVRMIVLGFLAFLVSRTVRQEKELRVLRGLLRICMFCKRIRDQHGDWQRLELYIAEHSEAAFTHALCPECAEIHSAGIPERERNAGFAQPDSRPAG